MSEKDTQTPDELSKVKASLAAIHYHSGKFSSRFWMAMPKSHLAATLKSIHEECEEALPELKKIRLDN